ncbi:MAG: phosphatidylglycerophosphatase A [Kiritimatiellae bacterium]|nr:phosphatidylglycerophosphatase A [Kiritimatiellia bacterium]
MKRIYRDFFEYPAGCVSRFVKYALLAAATGFGLGLSPVASGTTGTLPGVLLMFCLAGVWSGPVIWQICCAAALAAAAVPLCDLAEKYFQHKDDGRIVADEYLTFPICMIGLPVCAPVLVMAFLTNRVFDILKPFPARRLQALPGGLGIVADDFFSCLYSLVLNHLAFRLLIRFGLIGG